jgi:acyl-coenzyme A synthetase/AMP-(fatty) acid ligase
MSESGCTLFETLSPDVPVAFWKGAYIYPEQFQLHVFGIAEALPDQKYAVNLCEDRYLFLVSFAACLLKSQTSLLPPSCAEKEIERLLNLYDDAYCIVDNKTDADQPGQFAVQLGDIKKVVPAIYGFDRDVIAAIVFTSGSTGTPKPHQKCWKDLVTSSLKLKQALDLEKSGFDTIVATVPPQHMYGFEMSIIYPLVNRACMHAGRPFFPLDMKNDIQGVAAPRVLVTTPIHLRACNEADMSWPEIKAILSAASELPEEVARTAEIKMKSRVQEVYGCTEAGAIATRQTTRDKRWNLLEGYRFTNKPGSAWLSVPGIEDEIELPDMVDTVDEKGFYLVGRNSDIIKIGGKRASMASLVNTLKSIGGVEDGLIFNPEPVESKRQRLAAIVVAPGVSENEILLELSKHIDQVFLPRQIIKVNHLPYSDTGKLTMDSICAIFNRRRSNDDQQVKAKCGYGG